MFNLFRRSAAPEEGEPVAPRLFDVGRGRRVYAVGDIHGRYDLLAKMIQIIVEDHRARVSTPDFHLVLLGDLIDRGPDSARVVDLALSMQQLWSGFTCIQGNHEEVFLQALRGDVQAQRFFRRLGRETLISYGIEPELIDTGSDVALYEAMLRQVPVDHRDFLGDLPSSLVLGDYLFVHAGIRPGLPLEDQDDRDLHWIRGEFLNNRMQHPYMVVHGHSITPEVDEQMNRIGIDTGAYASDRLTAIGLEGIERWFLST